MEITSVQNISIAEIQRKDQQLVKIADMAQYGGSDYANAVRVERQISLAQAKEIAQNDPEIDYFFYVKGGMMVLVIPPDVIFDPNNDPLDLVNWYKKIQFDDGHLGNGYARVFLQGDAVFFKDEGKKWLGTAPGLADVYVKPEKSSE